MTSRNPKNPTPIELTPQQRADADATFEALGRPCWLTDSQRATMTADAIRNAHDLPRNTLNAYRNRAA